MSEFDKSSTDRITAAVLRSETTRRMMRARRKAMARQDDRLATIAFATADVSHDAVSDFAPGQGSPGLEQADVGADTLEACNSLHVTVWEGAKVELEWLGVADSDGSSWHVVTSWSATRIRGTASTSRSGEGFVMLTGIRPMNGHFDPSSQQAYLLAGRRIETGMAAIADWNESAQRWETVGCCGQSDSELCNRCSGDTPPSFDVQFTGITDGSCADCDDVSDGFNQTFNAPYAAAGACTWIKDITSQANGCLTGELNPRNYVTVYVSDDGTNTTIHVVLTINSTFGQGQDIEFLYTGSSGQEDCDAWSNKSIPYWRSSGSGYCVGTSASCYISAST